jgi:choline dehydrogenase
VTPTHYLTYPQQGATAAMTIGVNVTQPQSSGCVRLVSQSPQDAPSIEPRYFDHEVDLSQTIRGVRLARDIASRSPLVEFIRRELVPGEKRFGDAEIARAVGRYAQTLYHPVGTCRLGLVDSVIDQRFAVHGVERLWVVDASILPQLTEGNPNATVMTLAWLAAEMISEQVTH